MAFFALISFSQDLLKNVVQNTVFKCDLCDVIFSEELTLNEHVQTKHPNIEFHIQEIL